jgi:hypothetical protein
MVKEVGMEYLPLKMVAIMMDNLKMIKGILKS